MTTLRGPDEPTRRFTNRVADYVRYRPHYPAGLWEALHDARGLVPTHAVADLGSGTGLLSRVFTDRGHVVHGVEPNAAMRAAGEHFLAGTARFHSVDGTAEATGLPDDCVDVVVAGQAFHWFDPAGARRECLRILRPGGFAVLVWNHRQSTTTAFLREYEALIVRHGRGYPCGMVPGAEHPDVQLFFGGTPETLTLPNAQIFDLEGLTGRLASSSYAPARDDPGHGPMLADLRALFDRHQVDGRVTIGYDTVVLAGPLVR